MTLLLSAEETVGLISMPEAIASLEAAYRWLDEAEAAYRPRSDLVVPLAPGQDYWLSTMEGAVRPLGVAAIRLRSDRYEQIERHGKPLSTKWAGRPGLFCGLVILYSLETAEPLAIIGDGRLQLLRVAATAAVAAKYLARPDSAALGVIGAGWQAREHLRAYASLFPLQEVRVFARTQAGRESFAREMGKELGLEVRAVGSAREAVEGSDIVAACTNALEPVLSGAWVAPGAFVSSIRYFREIGPENAAVFDLHVVHPPEYGWSPHRAGRPAEWARAPESSDLYRGDVLPPGVLPLQGVVSGRLPGRTSPAQRTLFNNHAGMGLQFAALGKLAYERALARGVGRRLPTEWLLMDVTS